VKYQSLISWQLAMAAGGWQWRSANGYHLGPRRNNAKSAAALFSLMKSYG